MTPDEIAREAVDAWWNNSAVPNMDSLVTAIATAIRAERERADVADPDKWPRPQFMIGDRVRKVRGYPFPGVVVAVFTTTAGLLRVVVECTVPEVAGCLHIYSPDQLAHQETTDE